MPLFAGAVKGSDQRCALCGARCVQADEEEDPRHREGHVPTPSEAVLPSGNLKDLTSRLVKNNISG